jgi:hypothetical protein
MELTPFFFGLYRFVKHRASASRRSPCDYTSQNLPRETWDDIDLFDFFPNEIALQHTREALAEVAGMVTYLLAGEL